jgi:uncharacterized protein YdhG (YjbR/CyaY superfamily)
MEGLSEFLNRVADPEHRARLAQVYAWTAERFPELALEIKWNQPMFTHHGTFVVSYGAAKPHLSVAPEGACLDHFEGEIVRAGYARSREHLRIPWTSPVEYELLARMIEFNIADKAETRTFWRK